jgi:GTPase Era involved in 16S rRNA processing
LEVTRLRQQLLHRVTVGVVGSPSCGKDAAIMALFGVDTGNIDPVAGATKSVEITRLPGATALYIVNTPGLGDVMESVTEEARQVLDHIDLYVYIVNAQGGVQARELADYSACRATRRPVLAVINKVDTLRDSDKERYLADAQQKLGAPPADFLSAAFDPLPQLADAPIGVKEVHRWLHEHLIEAGKAPEDLTWCAP